jgi:hypothetical protein
MTKSCPCKVLPQRDGLTARVYGIPSLYCRLGLLPIRLSSLSVQASEQSRARCNVELFAELLSAITAVVLSVSCGLLLEELVFGGLARLFLVARSIASEKPSPKQKDKGERICLP